MRNAVRLITLAGFVAGSVSCGDVVRNGSSPVYLTIVSLLGSRGNVTAGQPTSVVLSDVLTNVTSPTPCTPTTPCPTIFDDPGVVTLRAPLKNLGNGTLSPTSNNDVTISRYHVEYIRADGRNTPGVDVPYPFDGAVTGTIVAGTQTSFTFELVRHVAKQESPLVQLVRSSNIITTIARVSFYGQDRTGNAVSVTGDIQVNFGNFGDF